MPSNRYFHISSGLRGCYMPDSSYVGMFKTRRELAAALHSEAASILNHGESDLCGLSRRDVSALAARAWLEAGKKGSRAYLPFVAPYGPKKGRSSDYGFGLFCGVASRSEYLESKESEHD